MKSIIQRQLAEFNKLLDKIVSDKGRSQTFISTKHSIEMEQWLTQSYKEVLKEVGDEVVENDDWHYHIEGGVRSSATGNWKLCEVCSRIRYYEKTIEKKRLLDFINSKLNEQL